MPLATIQKITEIIPHENADSLEIARVLGWEVIVKKDEFKAGDFCVYVEVDSILPEKSEFEFLRNKNFRICTIKLRGIYSQGICFPLSILPVGIKKGSIFSFSNQKHKEGQDVTSILGIKKYEKPEPRQPQKSKYSNFWFYLCWRIRKMLGRTGSDEFPTDIVSKTDEDKIQSCPGRLEQFIGKECYVTIKHNGTSTTYVSDKKKKFLVCSRNTIKRSKDNVYWLIALAYNIKNKLSFGYVIQGEIVGPKIQGNSESLKSPELRVFNIYKDRKALNYDEMIAFCSKHSLPMVDLYYRGIFKWNSIKEIMDEVDKAKYKNGKRAEGLVFRLVDNPKVSFKAVSPVYCLKHGE